MINSAIYWTSNTQGITLTIIDSNFTNNIINGWYGEKGGTFLLTGSNLISINYQFISNAAFIEGGGIYGEYKSTASFTTIHLMIINILLVDHYLLKINKLYFNSKISILF